MTDFERGKRHAEMFAARQTAIKARAVVKQAPARRPPPDTEPHVVGLFDFCRTVPDKCFRRTLLVLVITIITLILIGTICGPS